MRLAVLLVLEASGIRRAILIALDPRLGTWPSASSSTHHPVPTLPGALRLPPVGVEPGTSRTHGGTIAPFVGFSWKLHPKEPLLTLRVFQVASTPGKTSSFLAAGQNRT